MRLLESNFFSSLQNLNDTFIDTIRKCKSQSYEPFHDLPLLDTYCSSLHTRITVNVITIYVDIFYKEILKHDNYTESIFRLCNFYENNFKQCIYLKNIIYRFALLTSLQMYNFVHINRSKNIFYIIRHLSGCSMLLNICEKTVILENRTPQCL